MNKILKLLTFLALLGASTAHAGDRYPTVGVMQEMAGTTAEGEVSVDLYDTTAYNSHVRIGMFGGEVMYRIIGGGGVNDRVGYKHPFNDNMAAYGLIFFSNAAPASVTDITLGFSYSGGDRDFMYNVNLEIDSPTGAPNTTWLKGGAYYAVSSRNTGRMYITGELIMNMTINTTDLYAGLRFAPKKNVNIDIGAFQSIGGAGAGAGSAIGVPLFFRLNLGV